jgi:AhpD family alkylhydroperoxidase
MRGYCIAAHGSRAKGYGGSNAEKVCSHSVVLL